MKTSLANYISAAILVLLLLSACGLGTDAEPASLSVPEDVFPSETADNSELESSEDTTFHPVYHFKDELLVEIQRPLPVPVFLDAPLNNLLSGPTESEAAAAYASAIPAETEIVHVEYILAST